VIFEGVVRGFGRCVCGVWWVRVFSCMGRGEGDVCVCGGAVLRVVGVGGASGSDGGRGFSHARGVWGDGLISGGQWAWGCNVGSDISVMFNDHSFSLPPSSLVSPLHSHSPTHILCMSFLLCLSHISLCFSKSVGGLCVR